MFSYMYEDLNYVQFSKRMKHLDKYLHACEKHLAKCIKCLLKVSSF